MIRILLAAVGVIGLLSPSANAQTVDEVIAKNVEARGGMEKIKSIKTIRTSGKVNAGFFRAAFQQENKRPERVREEVTIQGLTQVRAYDGKTGWQVSPFGGRRDPELLAEDDMKDLVVEADIEGPLVDYKQKGHTAELMGHDSVEGTDCYKVKLTLKNGDVRLYYLDADSYLAIKLEAQSTIRGSVQETETFYGDYDQVNGVYFPFAWESGQKGDAERAKYVVERIETNTTIDDAAFTMPAKKTAAKPAGGGK
jgi:Outer membrane lipoprotein-sorting protein